MELATTSYAFKKQNIVQGDTLDKVSGSFGDGSDIAKKCLQVTSNIYFDFLLHLSAFLVNFFMFISILLIIRNKI